MERIYAYLENVGVKEEQLPSGIGNKINKIEILTDKYNSRCDLLDEIEDEESEKYKSLDKECEELDAEIDAMEENIIQDIKAFVESKNQQANQGQTVAASGIQVPAGNPNAQKKKASTGFWIFAGIVAVVTLGAVVMKKD